MPKNSRNRFAWLGVRASAFALIACCSLGCQSWAPSNPLSELASSRADAKTAKLASHDPFPSPADLGIEMRSE